jgi:tetratricopeptide (TPR) repeat protein
MTFWIKILLVLALAAATPGTALAATASVVTLLRQSQIAQARGQIDQALELVGQALSQDPAYPPLWTQKAGLQIAKKDYAAALETLKLALGVQPDDTTANVLALTALLRLDEASGGKDPALARYLAGRSEKTTSALLLDLLAKPKGKADLARFLAAWKPTTDADNVLARLLAGYVAGDRTALQELADRTADGPRKDVLSALQFYAGKRMLSDKKLDLAKVLLEKALAGGYDQVAADGELGWVYYNQDEPAKAADLWEKDWRNAPDVGQWAVWIADGRLAAKDYKRAGEFLKTGLQFDPKNPVLQGQYILALNLSGQETAAADYEDSLRDTPDQDGLHFGLALTAWHKNDYAAAAEALRAIKNRTPFRDQYIELANTMVGTIGKTGDTQKIIAQVDALVEGLDVRPAILRDIGWRLWAARRPDAALSFWKQSLSDGLSKSDPLVARVVPLLLETGKIGDAMALLKAHAPQVTPLGLAWTLAAVNRWDLVDKALGKGRSGPYADLLAAMAGLQNGQAELALEKMRALAALPADGFPRTTVTGFDPDGRLVQVALTPPLAGALYLRIVRSVAATHFDQGFFFLTPPAWVQGVAPKDLAKAQTEAGRELWRAGRVDAAAKFLEAALAADPGDNTAKLYLALARKRQGKDADAQKLLAQALAAASPFDREYAQGEFAALDDDDKAALTHFQNALALTPGDERLRLRVIALLLAADQFAAAKSTGQWFEAKVVRGDKAVFGTAAAVRLELGDPAGAESLYRALLERAPNAPDYLSGLGLALNRQDRYEQTVAALTPTYAAAHDPNLGGILCEALMSLGRYAEAAAQAEAGLATHPKDRELLRYAAEASEFTRDLAACEGYVKRYLEQDPDSLRMQDLLGRLLLDQEKYPEAKEHFEALLAKNPDHIASLRGLLSIAQIAGNAAEAHKVATRLHEVAPDNAAISIEYAIAAASDHDFKPAYKTLERLHAFGPGSGVLCLYYRDVRDTDAAGKVRLSQLAAHLHALAAHNGHFLGMEELSRRPVGDAARKAKDTDLSPSVLVLVDRTAPAVLEKIDALLAAVGGKAVLVVGGESLAPQTPYLPDAAALAKLLATGRWSLALTDHNPPRVPGPGGLPVSLWSVAGATRGATDKTAMEARLSARLKALDPSGKILGDKQPVFFYPDGYAPDDLLVADAAARDAYTDVVARNFPVAVTISPDGFWTPITDPRLTATKAVLPAFDVPKLEIYLDQSDPLHAASLALAKVYSWQEQLGQADNYFAEAEKLKVNPEDLTYNHAVNAYYEYDDPVALAEKAVELDPESERAQIQLARAKLRTRPKAEFIATTWWDSDNRRYTWYGLGGNVHLRDDFTVFARAGEVQWSLQSYQRHGQMIKAVNNTLDNGYLAPEDAYNVFHSRHTQYLNGQDLTVGARWFFLPEYWVEAQGQLTTTAGGPGPWPNGQVTVHGPIAPKNTKVDGTWELQGASERIDTVEAISAQIMANRVSLFTHARILDFWDMFLNGSIIARTDGNNTGSVDGRLLRRLFDYPMVSLGYAFQFANSDRSPLAYWAPLDLATHLAYASFGYSPTRWFNINGSLGYGPSRDRSNDWRNIWRANAGMDITMRERLKLSLKYSYFSTPTYNLSEAWASISYTF